MTTEPEYELPAEPEPPRSTTPLNRMLLFRVQTFISLLLLGVTLMNYIGQTDKDAFLKIVASPFGGLSVAVFVMFLTATVITQFNANRAWKWQEILASVGLLLAVGGVMQVLMGSILELGGTLSRLLFLYSMLFSGIALIYFRVRNLWTMGIITGVAEGIVVFLVFSAK
jgi:hypothetical protein